MAEYIYPAIFHSNDDGSFTITFPDLPGCISEGKSLENALHMAQSALSQWISYLQDKKLDIPVARNIQDVATSPEEFAILISGDIRDNRAAKRTVSIP